MNLDLGAIALAMKRPGYNDDQPFYGAIPFFSVSNDWGGINVTYVPEVEQDALAFWLAYVHPAWMIASLALAILTLRAGLRLRRARRLGLRRKAADLQRHLRLAKPAVAMILLGFAGGPVSAVWLRGWDAFHTFHAWIAMTAVALYVATAVLGRRLERGRGRPVEAHARLALLATFAAAAAFVAGFVLLP